MVVIAVVGGTGNVGKTLVDAFVEDKKYDVIVLARKVPEGGNAAPAYAVNYNDVSQLMKTLETNNVHTVISTISMGDEAASNAELNLIEAASKASPTKRFVASSWGTPAPADESMWIPHNGFRARSVEALRKTKLEWTQIHNGLFLDYYGMPHVESYLQPLPIFIDVANHEAGIPGTTGDEVLSFTYTKDLGKFVVAAQSLPHWDEGLHCYGDNATLKEVVSIAEEMTESNFAIAYDPVEKLQRGEITELPSHKAMYPFFPKPALAGLLSRFGLWAAHGLMSVEKKGSLNEKFPDIKTSSVRDILSVWKGK